MDYNGFLIMNQCIHLFSIGNRLLIGRAKFGLSMETGFFVDEKLCLRSVARKKADFMAEKMFPISAAKKRGVFLAGCVAYKKETPSKGCLCNIYTISRRISAASSASARCSQNIEAAGTPGPTEGSGRHAPNRGCQR